jgi:hypothetical protein
MDSFLFLRPIFLQDQAGVSVRDRNSYNLSAAHAAD